MIKPQFLKVQENNSTSFDMRYEKVPYFDNPWHYHPELELTLITKSTGIRFVGDSVERFEAGDLVLLGAHLPHYWRNDTSFHEVHSKDTAEAIILRFRLDFLGKSLLASPEMGSIKQLFQQAAQGLGFGQKVSASLQVLMLKLHQSQGVDRLLIFLEIFKTLAETDDFRILSTKTFAGSNPNNDSDRINRVLNYIHLHLHENIKLEAVAALSNMNTTAFCRYIKAQTNKTFIALLNEMRIANACRLLLDRPRDVAEISYECGFDNVTHFNYTFKKITGQNPTTYRKGKIDK